MLLTRFIESILEIVRPSPVKLEVLVDLRHRAFDLGGGIEVTVAITPRRDAADVVQCGVALVLEFEIVRKHTNMVSTSGGMGVTASVPKTVQTKSVDYHRLDAVALLDNKRLDPERVTFPARLAVPKDPPRPPDEVVSSVDTWKVVATLELEDGSTFRAEQVVTKRG